MKISINNKSNLSGFVLDFLMRRLARKLAGTVKPLACMSFDAVATAINVYGTYEKDEILALEYFLDEFIDGQMECALDIGANIGNHTVRFLQRKFKNVQCFEPNEILCDLLKLNTADFTNVTVRNLGLSNEIKNELLTLHETNWGGGTVGVNTVPGKDGAWNEIPIRLVTLDSLIEEFSVKIDFIKLDAEGHEKKIIEGASQLIEEHKPIVAFEEHNIDNEGSSELIKILRGKNYEIYQMSENFYLGDGKISKVVKLICQDLFGKKIRIRKSVKLDRRMHHLIIAVPA